MKYIGLHFIGWITGKKYDDARAQSAGRDGGGKRKGEDWGVEAVGVWETFAEIMKDDDQSAGFVMCTSCDAIYTFDSHKTGTTNQARRQDFSFG